MKNQRSLPARIRVFVFILIIFSLVLLIPELFLGSRIPPPETTRVISLSTSTPSVSTPVANPTASDPITEILQSLPTGNIAFNVPQSMNRDDTKSIQLKLSLVAPIDDLKKSITEEGEKEGTTISVSDLMEADLTGSNFTITGVTPETQVISSTDETEWEWDIKPTDTGLQKLHLTLSVLLDFKGTSTPRAVRTFDKEIDVEVTPGQQISSFIGANWQWLWTVILVPIGAWVWSRRRKNNTPPSNV